MYDTVTSNSSFVYGLYYLVPFNDQSMNQSINKLEYQLQKEDNCQSSFNRNENVISRLYQPTLL